MLLENIRLQNEMERTVTLANLFGGWELPLSRPASTKIDVDEDERLDDGTVEIGPGDDCDN